MSIKEALDILDQIEYSSDGFVKRYPEQKEYEKALETLKEFYLKT